MSTWRVSSLHSLRYFAVDESNVEGVLQDASAVHHSAKKVYSTSCDLELDSSGAISNRASR